MILTFDIGNANMVMCCVEDGAAVQKFILSSSKERTADEYTVIMKLLSDSRGIDLAEVSGAIIASVVPQLTSVIASAVTSCTGKAALIVGPGVKTGLNIRMDDPSELGADLVAAAVGASGIYENPCILIDFGTATTIGIIDAKGAFVGGLICAGVMMEQTALAKGASQLPNVSVDAPARVIGKNTVDCMQSGIAYGTAAMLDGLISRIESELGAAATVISTGQLASKIIPHCARLGIIIDDDLVMRGLWSIYKKNR